ncbi:MAG: hypothetical protein ACYC55_02860 [Candidatus Geothermincolia bacterium]
MKKRTWMIAAIALAVMAVMAGVAIAAGPRGSGVCDGTGAQQRLQDGTGVDCTGPADCPNIEAGTGDGVGYQLRQRLQDGTCDGTGAPAGEGSQIRAGSENGNGYGTGAYFGDGSGPAAGSQLRDGSCRAAE